MYQKNVYFHALRIMQENCTGCTACVKVCPTEAIRIRNKTIVIDERRCIDCGNCITACSFKAIVPYYDEFDIMNNFKHKIAIFSTAYAGQFSEENNYATIKKTILRLGFDEVAEESSVVDFMTEMIQKYIRENQDIRPVLSSGCPAVVRLIQVRFPSLLSNLFHIEAPMSILSYYLREQAKKKHNFTDEEIGVFLIVPCVSQVTAVHQPEGTYKSYQDGAFSIKQIYSKAQEIIKETWYDNEPIDTYESGLTYGIAAKEADRIDSEDIRVLSVTGIDNCIEILSRIEDHHFDQYQYVVLRSCDVGCVGGGLNVENKFIAMSRLKKLANKLNDDKLDYTEFWDLHKKKKFDVLKLKPRSIMELDDNLFAALEKIQKIQKIVKQLPGINCSACGCPTCYALAEDIVQGKAKISDCVILYKQNLDKIDKKG
ncbi:MAG: [Fe-Fe] hydrogenase large subunit C-terminal domain-containing protein [Candidatus Cloacimonadales bacterium]